MESPAIPDELLVDIFLRLPNPADLIRASAACVSFRRLVAGRSFLRRFRKLHAPPLLGFLDQHRFHPAVPPYPSAPAAGAVATAADFSFAFLPSPASRWSVRDVRDGRVLLDRPRQDGAGEGGGALFEEMAVCDPLYRQYRLLPPIPHDLAALVKDPLWIDGDRCGETFLVPPGDDEEVTDMDETSFRVIWMAQCKTKPVAFVFCSGTAQWRATPSVSWSGLLPGFALPTWMSVFSWRQYAYGCFYWMASWCEKFLMLDSRRMEFSMTDRPPGVRGICHSVTMAIVEAGEGMTGMFVPAQDTFSLSPHDTHRVSYTIRRNNGGSSSHWQMEKTIPMGSGCSFMGSLGRHLLLYMCGSSSLEAGCFTLDVKTFKLERATPTTEECATLCRFLNYGKLTLEAGKDLAKNRRILPGIAVQAMSSQRLPKLQTPSCSPTARRVVGEEEALRLDLRRMQGWVVELEMTCKEMRGQTRKVSRMTAKGANKSLGDRGFS